MNLRDYIFGRRIVLHSNSSRKKIEEAINRAASSSFSPFNHGVTGGMWFGRVRLAWSIPFFSNGFRPVFTGKFKEKTRGVELHASYGAPFFQLGFLAIWFLFLTLFLLIGLIAWSGDGIKTGNEWMIFPIVLLMMMAPFGFHFIFNANADKHFDAILDLLEREADLLPV